MFGSSTFNHGIHPAENKETASLPIARMPFVERYILPLSQHAGAPSKAVVTVGQRVVRGQLLAGPGGFVSTSLHSPVTGKVVAIAPRRHPNGQFSESIELLADAFSSQEQPVTPPVDWARLPHNEFVAQVQQGGLVGLGGAAFPAHVKYSPPEGKKAKWLVINGCECEPYLTCDHRTMLERPAEVIRGIEIVAAKLGVERTFVGIEANKQDACEALRKAAAHNPAVEVRALQVKYPQGAEKMLIEALFGEEVPAGKLPIDIGIVVNNVSTMAALADWFDRGAPLTERVVTVAGPGIERPANLLVPLGTPVRDVLQACGLRPETRQVIMGGPMMGQPLASLDVPVVKGTSGLLAFTEEVDRGTEHACVKCGRCLDACANFLNPSRLARLARVGRHEDLERLYVMDCMECCACSWVCPSGIPIVQLIRSAKAEIREQKSKKKDS